MPRIKGRWALVTGASAGIGLAIAEELASCGCHLFLVARRASHLDAESKRLASAYHVQTKFYATDLSKPGAGAQLLDQLGSYPISVLVNNVGFGLTGSFKNAEWSMVSKMIDLNVKFTVEFTRRLLPRLLMVPEGSYIMNVGSVAGFQGVPYFAAYAASKAFVNTFSEGLHAELLDTSVSVTSLEPGQTHTNFFEVAGMTGARITRWGVMSPRQVAVVGVKAMLQKKPKAVPGFMNQVLIFSSRFIPRVLIRRTMSFLFRDLSS